MLKFCQSPDESILAEDFPRGSPLLFPLSSHIRGTSWRTTSGQSRQKAPPQRIELSLIELRVNAARNSLLCGKSTKIFIVPSIAVIYKARLHSSFGPPESRFLPSSWLPSQAFLQPLPLHITTKHISLFLQTTSISSDWRLVLLCLDSERSHHGLRKEFGHCPLGPAHQLEYRSSCSSCKSRRS